MEATQKIVHIYQDLEFLSAEIWLCIGILVVVGLDMFFYPRHVPKLYLAIGVLVIVGDISWIYVEMSSGSFMQNLLYLSPTVRAFKLIFASATLMGMYTYIQNETSTLPEVFYTLLFMLLGAQMLAMASHFLSAFVALEIVSLCSYMLIAYTSRQSYHEAAMKYILFGIFSAAITLYGISLLYGFTGTLDIKECAFLLNQQNHIALTLPFLMLLGGFFFKITAFPFHTWSPDIYVGSKSSILGTISTLPKIAGFSFLLYFFTHFQDFLLSNRLSLLVFGVWVALSMLVGNLAALRQDSIKKMLAYSGIAQSGFMLLPLFWIDALSEKAVIFYSVAIVLGNFATFQLVAAHEKMNIADSMKYLYRDIGIVGVAFTVAAISLVGIPPFIGFTAKFFVFTALWNTYTATENVFFIFLLLWGLLNTAISIFYYIKIPYLIYVQKPPLHHSYPYYFKLSTGQKTFAWCLLIGIFLFFVKPDWLFWVLNV